MFFREFPFDDALFVWDNIFAWYLCTGFSNIDLVDYIAVAMIVSLREYILQQIDSSGALQKLIKYARPIEANKVIKYAYKYELVYLETPMSFTAGDERPRSEPLKTPMLAGLVKDPKVTQSRYTPENIAKAKSEDRDAVTDVSAPKPEANEMKDLKKSGESVLKKSESSIAHQIQPTAPEVKETQTQPSTSANDPDKSEQASKASVLTEPTSQPQEAAQPQDRRQSKPSKHRVVDEDDEDLSQPAEKEPQNAKKVPLKTAGTDEDLFDGLIKVKPKPAALPKDISVPREFLSKINAKLYECISELQLENMRASSTKVSATISTLESLREQIFQNLSTAKSGQQPPN